MGPKASDLLVPLFALLPVSCGDAEGGGPERLSALVITLDTTRHDALSCTGGPPGISPNLDGLAAEGVLYERARTVCPLTMPAHASILTGLYPPRHTVRTNSQLALPESADTLAERASARGVQTGAFVASVVLAHGFGLEQGFDEYDQPTPPLVQQTVHYDRRRAREVADAAIVWLEERDPERPFLMWVHFFDPHLPHQPPQRFLELAKGDTYHAEVAAMDFAIGRILDALRDEGVYDETMIVVVADHGEGRTQHGEDTHGTLVYDSTLHVPMIVRHPDGWRAGERSDEVVSVVDVFPTLVEALELGNPGDVDGQSLFRRQVAEDRGVYFESYYGFLSFGWSPLAGWADARAKYVHGATPELFDTRADPGELRNLYGDAARDTGRYREAIGRLAARKCLERSPDDVAAVRRLQQLQDLGYTGSAAGADGLPHPLEPTDLPAPQERKKAFQDLMRAQELNVAGRHEDAIRIYRRIVSENPRNHNAWFQLGAALIVVERYGESIEASSRSLDLYEWHGSRKNLGLAHAHLEHWEQALEHYDRALAIEPNLVEVVDPIILILGKLGRESEAPRYHAFQIRAREKQLAGEAQ
ncbi:MAG: sulfatase-like hydrolase/transferase [Planctomycetota bacterium]|nr:sulfatase-like hydrolase/transferase [Planctomycetota bacterium]